MENQIVAWMCPKGFVYGLHETRPVEANIPLQVVTNPTIAGFLNRLKKHLNINMHF
jgi:hypothetical protein